MSVEDAAKVIGRSSKTVRRFISTGRFGEGVRRIDGLKGWAWRISPEAVEALRGEIASGKIASLDSPASAPAMVGIIRQAIVDGVQASVQGAVQHAMEPSILGVQDAAKDVQHSMEDAVQGVQTSTKDVQHSMEDVVQSVQASTKDVQGAAQGLSEETTALRQQVEGITDLLQQQADLISLLRDELQAARRPWWKRLIGR